MTVTASSFEIREVGIAERRSSSGSSRYPFSEGRSLSEGTTLPIQWRVSMDGLLEMLDGLPGLTESRFLDVGANLANLTALLREIEENAAAAGGLMAGEATVESIRELEQILVTMGDHFESVDRRSERASAALHAIIGEMRAIHGLMVNFNGHVGNLRMLKTLTNIQSASHFGKGANFSNVAGNIGALSQNVQSKSTAIILRVRHLQGDLERAIEMAGGLGEVQKELGCKVVSTIRSQISALVAMNDKCSHAAHDISGSSAKISRDVHEIVVALQFQDITRQQMEHATEALVNMRSSLEANAVKAGEAAEICALQSAQLVHSSDELLSAVARIAVTLKTVARESEAITAGAHALFQQADLMGHASVESIEHGLNTIATAFSENIDTNRKLIEIMRGVSDDLGEINTFAEDIDYIGSEIRLIALNAIIMAAQAGEAGAGFSVIAQTVKQQSEDICRQAAAITTSIHAITDHVAELQAFLTEDGEGEAEGSGADKRRGELEKAIVRLNEVTCNATDILSRTDEASERLASLIGEALSALESRDVARTLKGEVIPRLDRLVATLSAGNNDISQGDGIARLNRRYTMESERNIHRRFAVITPASAGGNREVAASTNDASGKDGLGDNVEFF